MDEARIEPEIGSASSAMRERWDAPPPSIAPANPGLRKQVTDSVREAREQVTTQVREHVGTAKDSATRMVDERKRTLTDSVQALASAFEAAATSLNDGNQARLADWTRELSGRARRIASYLEEQDTRGLVTDLEGTAKQNPTAFLGTSFAAGLAAGRFLRSSVRATDTGALGDFHPDPARVEPVTSGMGYGNPGSGYGTTGSAVGATRTGPGDAGFGPVHTEPTPEPPMGDTPLGDTPRRDEGGI